MTHTKKKVELARECKTSRPTLDAYLKDPSFPKEVPGKGWPVAECQRWVDHVKKEAATASKDSDIFELKRREIYERGRKLKIANDIKEGELIAKKHVATVNSKVASKMRLWQYQMLCNEIPPEARDWGIKKYDEFCRMAQAFGELWD